ncbi:hypothetical protein Tco_1263010 [Tanacetum coccineum]
MSKEVETPRYLSLVVLLKKVGDEAVHKELGDRVERAATTASSLEVEQDSGSGPRGYTLGSGEDNMKLLKLMELCTQLSYKNRKSVLVITGVLKLMLLSIQFLLLVYINAAKLMLILLGSVNAVRHMLMLPVQVPAAEETHNVVAFLEKPVESDGFTEIIDFLKASSIHYASTINPIIYTSCIEQFWATAKVQTVIGVRGTDCLPTTTIFEELTYIGAKSTAWNEFSSTMSSLIICLAKNQKFNLSKYIFDAMVKHLDGRVKFLMYPRFLQVFINQQLGDMSQHKKIFVNPFHTKKVFANMKRAGKDFSGRITPLSDTMMQKQKSKRRQRKEVEVPQDETEHEESVPTTSNDPQPSGEDSMQLNDLIVLCTKLQAQTVQFLSPDLLAFLARLIEFDRVNSPTYFKANNIDADAEVTLVNETEERQDDDLMFDTRVLDDDKVFVDVTTIEKEEQSTKTCKAVTTAGVEDIKDKGKGIIQEHERPLTKKDQVAIDEDLARNIQAQLDAEIIEEERLERQKQEEANIALIESWENTQAMMEANRLLAEKLQTKEREELTDEEKGKLFMKLMKKRRKHFVELRAQEKRNRPPTKAQKRTQMSTYLKHMGGYKHKQLMGKSYDEIQNLFDKEMKRVNTFVAMSSKVQESNEKKEEEGDKETIEVKEVEEDDEAELKKHLVIKKDDDIAIDLIRVDGSSKRHSSMIRLLQGIDKEDLQTLWKLVKTKHGDLRPEDEHERVLWGDLKVMFEPDIRSDV